MKRLISILLVCTMFFSLAGCFGEEDIRGDITNNSETNSTVDEEKTEEKEFSLGKTSGSNYENTFLGIGCNLDANWSFYSDTQIKELNNIVGDAVGDDIAEQIQDAEIIYDMYAIHSNGTDNININLENVGLIESAAINLETRLKNTIPMLEEGLTNIGCTNIVTESTTIEIDGEKFAGLDVTAEISGLKLNETIFCIKSGKYIASVTIAAFGDSDIQQIIDCFYVVK